MFFPALTPTFAGIGARGIKDVDQSNEVSEKAGGATRNFVEAFDVPGM